MPASRNRLLLGALILAILGASGWWVLRSAGEGAAPSGGPEGTTAVPGVPPEPGALTDEPEAVSTLAREEATRATAPEPPALGEPVLTIRAVHAVTREPVPHAEILYIWREDPDFLTMLSAWRTSDRETEMRRHGQSIRTNERGEARIPVAGTIAQLAARSGSLYGAGASFANESGPRESVLLLGEDRRLTVKVVNDAGAPVADVPVCLYTPSDRSARDPRWTNGEGIAVFGHLQTFFQNEGEVPDLALTFAFPALDRPRVPIRWQDPPAEPVILVMPPTGTLAVEVLEAAGGPWRSNASIHLQQHVETPPNFDRSVSFQPRLALGVTLSATDEQGVARFPFVGLGLQLDAAGQFTRGSTDWTAVTGPGPLAVGQEARLTLRVGPQPSVVVFRLLMPDGKLNSDQPFQHMLIWLDAAGQMVHWESGGTSSFDGIRRVPMPIEEPDGWARREIHMFQQEPVPGQLSVIAMLDVSAPLLPGENDFGDLRAQEPPLLAGGTVVDESEQPVFGANVSLASVSGSDPGAFSFLHANFPCITDQAGRFRLGGASRPGENFLVAKQPTYLTGRVPLVPGADTHRIVMPAACALTGKVLLDEGIPPREFEVGALRDGKRPRFINRPWMTTLQADGSFTLSGLEPGTVTLRFLHAGSGATILDVPDVILAADAAPDPRLNPLDLRGIIRRIRLLVLDPDGGQLTQAEYFVLDPARPEPNWGRTSNGQVTLYLSATSVTVGVRAAGYLGQIVEGLSADAEVRLERAQEVEFVLEDPGILQKHPNTHLQVIWLSPLGRRNSQITSQTVRLNAAGKGRYTLPGWGEFSVGIFVPVGDGSDSLDVLRANGEAWRSFSFNAGAPIPNCTIPGTLDAVERALAAQGLEQDE